MTNSNSNVIEFSSLWRSPLKTKLETTLESPSDEKFSEYEHNPKFGIFRIIDQREGDKRLVWNRMSIADIAEANNMFDQFIKQGLEAFRVGGNGKAGSRMEKFDPTAEEVLFLPMKMITGG